MGKIKKGLLLFTFVALIAQPVIGEAKDFHSKIFADIAKEAKNSVVCIITGTDLFSDLPQFIGIGAGFFVGDKGLIVTADHIINAAPEVAIMLLSREKFKAKIIERRPAVDIAILKIEGDIKGKARSLKLGDSDKVEDGDIVMTIGHPKSFLWSVTAGVISGRRMGEEEEYLQTDTSVNPGNSGGPLLNLEGEVIGIIDLFLEGAQGIALAIPSNVVRYFLAQIEKNNEPL